jgi:hypothetical protein
MKALFEMHGSNHAAGEQRERKLSRFWAVINDEA